MYLLFTILLSIQLIFAEAAHSISGTVINEQGLAIENVSVEIEDLDIGSTTDVRGYFLLQFSLEILKKGSTNKSSSLIMQPI